MGSQQVFDVLGDPGGRAAPLAETLPDLHRIGRGLFLPQEKVELVTVEPCGFPAVAVSRDASPHLVLDYKHSQLFELFAQFSDVVADKAVVDVHVGAVVEQVQTALDIDFQGRGDMVSLLFLLLQKGLVEVLQQRHFLGPRVLKVRLVDLMHTAVDNGFLDGEQALFSAHYQLAQREDEVRLQGDGIILLRIVGVDVHWVDKLGAGRRDFDNLTVQPLHQSRVLVRRIFRCRACPKSGRWGF